MSLGERDGVISVKITLWLLPSPLHPFVPLSIRLAPSFFLHSFFCISQTPSIALFFIPSRLCIYIHSLALFRFLFLSPPAFLGVIIVGYRSKRYYTDCTVRMMNARRNLVKERRSDFFSSTFFCPRMNDGANCPSSGPRFFQMIKL